MNEKNNMMTAPNYGLTPLSGEFIQAAQQVCDDIEQFHVDNTKPLLSSLIQLLHHSDKLVRSSVNFSDEDLDGEVALPEAVRSIPDDLVFQVVFDPLDTESVCVSSLRDSLGEIYEALKSGLNALENGKSEDAVIWQWKLEYETHWGRHVLDVIRFLFLCPREPGDK